MQFKLTSEFKPTGDQPTAINQLVAGIEANEKYQTLLGVTGSGKTFTMANAVQELQRPTLVLAHNKTLAAQLYSEFKQFVLENEFTYATASETMLKKMKDTAEDEKFYEDLKDEYEALLEKVVPSKERDLEKFKVEIINLLENEIVSRFHFQKGRAQHAFKNDEYLKSALEILTNQNKY